MRISILVASLLTIVAAVSITRAQSNKGVEKTIVGYITDSLYGLDHSAMKMGDDRECTNKCVEGGAKYALVDRAHRAPVTVSGDGECPESASGQE